MTAVIALLASSPAAFTGTCFALGLAIGSFLNVVIYRLPVMLERQWREQCAQVLAGDAHTQTLPAATGPGAERFDLMVPRSACPSCRSPIRVWQNIPVLSWLLLGGRCASCHTSIAIRYPLVELLTGVLSAAVAWRLGFGWPAAAALLLTWFLIPLAFIDIDHQLLPDSLTLPLLWIGLTLSLLAQPADIAPVPVDMRSSLIGAIAGYLSLWSVYHVFRQITGKEGMGYGDFKLLSALGAWLGWQMLLPVILIAAVLGTLIGVSVLTVRRQHRSTPIAFGPFLAVAGWLALMFGHPLSRYLDLFAPR